MARKLKVLVLMLLFWGGVLVVLLELFLRNSPIGDAVVQGLYDPGLPHHLVIRDYLPDTIYTFAPPEIRRNNPGGTVLDSYELHTDHVGFITPGRTHAHPDLTIAFVGGSTTECMYVQPELRFPYLTGKLLEQRTGLKINTLNAGRSGNTTMHSVLQLIAKIIPEKPDIVVIMNNTNDGGVLGGQGSYWNDSESYRIVEQPQNTVKGGLRMVRDALIPYTYRAVRRAVKTVLIMLQLYAPGAPDSTAAQASPPAPKLTPTPAKPQAAADRSRAKGFEAKVEQDGQGYRSAMTQFIATSQAWGIRPVVISQPTLEEGEWSAGANDRADLLGKALRDAGLSFGDFKNRHTYFNAIARLSAQDHRVDYIDLADSFKWTNNELYDGLHYTDAGSRIVARHLADQIEQIIAKNGM